MNTDIFRKVALDRLSSPEQLDELMEVTTTRAWAALCALSLLLVVTLAWGFMGTVPTKVHANGILIKRGGLGDVGATTNGQITAVYVDRGDQVKEGDVVAKMAQPEMEEEVAAAEGRMEELRADHDSLLAFGTQDQSLRSQEIEARRSNVRSEIRTAKERRRYLRGRLDSQEKLLEQGLVTRPVVEGTRREYQGASETLDDLQARLVQLQVEAMGTERKGEAELRSSELAIREAQRRLTYLEEKLENSTKVISLHAGRVLELRAAPGDVIRTGSPILSIELQGEESQPLEALLYIHSSQGKQVTPGMTVQVEPSVVRREEHGVVLADVTAVAEFPSTRHGMMRVLDNEELVSSFLTVTGGMPIAVTATLRVEESTPSGYEWSSGDGPQVLLSTGTPCAASITTREQRPITLVLPILRGLLGV